MATPTPRVTARMTVSTFPDIGQAATSSLPSHRPTNWACQPVSATAAPEACRAQRYSWRMKGLGSASLVSRAFQAPASMDSGVSNTRVT